MPCSPTERAPQAPKILPRIPAVRGPPTVSPLICFPCLKCPDWLYTGLAGTSIFLIKINSLKMGYACILQVCLQSIHLLKFPYQLGRASCISWGPLAKVPVKVLLAQLISSFFPQGSHSVRLCTLPSPIIGKYHSHVDKHRLGPPPARVLGLWNVLGGFILGEYFCVNKEQGQGRDPSLNKRSINLV